VAATFAPTEAGRGNGILGRARGSGTRKKRSSGAKSPVMGRSRFWLGRKTSCDNARAAVLASTSAAKTVVRPDLVNACHSKRAIPYLSLVETPADRPLRIDRDSPSGVCTVAIAARDPPPRQRPLRCSGSLERCSDADMPSAAVGALAPRTTSQRAPNPPGGEPAAPKNLSSRRKEAWTVQYGWRLKPSASPRRLHLPDMLQACPAVFQHPGAPKKCRARARYQRPGAGLCIYRCPRARPKIPLLRPAPASVQVSRHPVAPQLASEAIIRRSGHRAARR
jgi:hypothetical protein